jgi:hypothetical protein|tara:strand:+ start:324 stop:1439 length:1116 start_codon:yes stop_codon:yes gene_type:complete
MVKFHTYEDLPPEEQSAFLEKQGMTENEYLKKRNANLKKATPFLNLEDMTPEQRKEYDDRQARHLEILEKREKRMEEQSTQKEEIEKARDKYLDKLNMEIEPVPNHYIGKVQFSQEIVDEINEHIDSTRDSAPDMAAKLVGQLKNDAKSSQVDFDITTDVGQQVKTVFDSIGSAYLQQGYNRKSIAECFEIWTNHAYAGDYNPLHDHGARTTAGLSGFMWTKLPDCMTKQDVPEGKNFFNGASGIADGWTHMIWGLQQRRDVHRLYPRTEEYIQPKIGLMYVFPQWMKHQVLPFFGPGERRSVAMNWAVYDSEAELRNFFTPGEWETFYRDNIKDSPADTDESQPYRVQIDGVETYIRRDIFKEEKHPSEE